MSYNSDPNVLTLNEVLDPIKGSPHLRAIAVSKYFETSSRQHNALEQFTGEVNPKKMAGGGVRSIFAKRTDLSKGGGQTVHFGTIGTPGGPGVQGDTELTGNTSKSLFGSYPAIVDWVRDGVEWTKDDVAHIAAGGTLEQTTVDLLSHKMGIVKQNHGFMRLITSALSDGTTMGVEAGNVYRPNNKRSTDSLTAADTLSLETLSSGKARLSTLGARPLKRNLSEIGSPVDGYLLFTTTTGMLPIRNDSGFQTAIAQGDERGKDNANFSGELLKWQGQYLYEMPVTDEDWDDYKGGPLIAKAVLGTAIAGTETAPKLIVNAANTKSLYFQFFGGKAFRFNRLESLLVDTRTYYAWIINPDGSCGFVSYVASGNDGNQITIQSILSPNTIGSSKRARTVGELSVATTGTAFIGTGTTLPTSGANGTWVYTDAFQVGAVVLQANAKGVPYSRSFMFGSMAACFANGSVEMSPIQQVRDFGFVQGRGFEMIFGTCVVKNARKQINGYILIEHAIEHEGYPVPNRI